MILKGMFSSDFAASSTKYFEGFLVIKADAKATKRVFLILRKYSTFQKNSGNTVMRIAVIADIHGNQIAFEAVLADLAQQQPVDKLVIAGDLCLNGPRPAKY